MTEFDIVANALPESDTDAAFKKGLSEIQSDNNMTPGYHVTIKSGIIKEIPLFMKLLFSKEKIMIISDDTVAGLYSNGVRKGLAEAGFDAYVWTFAAGEKSKTMPKLVEFLQFMSEKEFTRSDVILSIGGGVVADMAGLAASLYMRGVKFVHVPTNLLSACDSCICGRNYVNLADSGNSCGSVYFPTAVYIDTDVIAKLKSDIFNQGMVEVIKSAILDGEEFFKLVEDGDISGRIEEIIARCMNVKNSFLSKSETESNERRVLNIGRIFARAVERVAGSSIGYAKSIGTGLAMTIRAGYSMGYCDKSMLDRVVALLRRYDLLLDAELSFSDIKNAVLNENRIGKGYLNLVVPYSIGDCRLVKVEVGEIDSWLRGAVEHADETVAMLAVN